VHLLQQRHSASRLQLVPDDGARLPSLDSVDAAAEFDKPQSAADFVAHGRSLSADPKRSVACGDSDVAAPGGSGDGSSRSPRWSSPASERRAAKTKSGGGGPATAASQSALVKLAADAAASGGLNTSRDKKKVPTKR